MHTKKIMLSGDRPTGDLHIGHYYGSIKNRIAQQENFECFFLIADVHFFTTKQDKKQAEKLEDNILSLAATYIACGLDIEKHHICLQSAIPAVYKINTMLGMTVPFNHLQCLASIKEMVKHSKIENLSIGLYNYPVLQAADILCMQSDVVPIGKDNESHLEISRRIAKKFNKTHGDTFITPKALISEKTLIGTDGQNKMSKSLKNAIFFTDSDESIEKKVKKMYTDPNRVRADSPGNVEGNPVFEYLYAFDKNLDLVNDMANRYRKGKISDVEVKKRLSLTLTSFVSPIREKIIFLLKNKKYLIEIITKGTKNANKIANATAKKMIKNMKMLEL